MLVCDRRGPASGRKFRRTALSIWLCAAVSIALPIVAQSDETEGTTGGAAWVRVDYSDLVNRRQLSHSGESVGALLRRLAANPGDPTALALLDPLLEPYAFVLQDAADSAEPLAEPPLVEVGYLWQPAQAQPAWAELLRARHYLVESDGQGGLRVFLPAAEGSERSGSAEAVRRAAVRSWPVLRHLFGFERKRLAQLHGRPLEEQALQIDYRVYRHLPAESVFLLGTDRWTTEVTDTRSAGRRPPLDMEEIEAFLQGKLRLEGARLERDGTLRLLGSRVDTVPTILGRPIELSDLAVAYRAVFHGGLAEPYMSLDRGYSPQTSIVNYGGRLRDTALGWISLLCDVRFKTFSQGLGIAEGRDLREEMRARIPSLRTHLERFAAHPEAQGLMSQHTRLWFYPDSVDLTVSAQHDLLAFRRVRMSASSERLAERSTAAAGGDPPWTRDTVDSINRHYDELAGLFGELGDLDQVVRLLSLFTWLQHAQSLGLPTPDLGALMALELPPLPTPRSYPQLLAFNALPAAEAEGEVVVFDRVPVGEALARLNPASGRPLPAQRRLTRALAALDPEERQNAALIEEVARSNPERLDDNRLDQLAFRAERLRMHQTVLSTLAPGPREEIASRFRAGEKLRIFSVGIGGLDLGMSQALANARSRSVGLVGVGAGGALTTTSHERSVARGGRSRAVVPEPREDWRKDPSLLPDLRIPEHGIAATKGAEGTDRGQHRIESGTRDDETKQRWLRWIYGADGPEPKTRMITLDDQGRAATVERLEQGRLLSYRMQRGANGAWRAVTVPRAGVAEPIATTRPGAQLPGGLATLELQPTTAPDAATIRAEAPAVRVRLAAAGTTAAGSPLSADFPRPLLQRVVTGPVADLTPGRPLSGFDPLPERLGQVDTVMCLALPAQRRPPWEIGPVDIVGEEDPIRLCSSLRDWWTDGAGERVRRGAVVGTEPEAATLRWLAAPRPAAATLVLPADGFPPSVGALRTELAQAWKAGSIVSDLAEAPPGELVVLISAEPPGLFAARLRELARSPVLQGKLLAAWSVSGPVRQDLPASLLAEGKLAGLGLAEAGVVQRREIVTSLDALSRALADPRESPLRVEFLPGPFTWFF